MGIEKELKQMISESGMPRRRLGIEAGVNRQSIARFMAGETGLSLEQADRLAEYFRLVLVHHSQVKQTRKGEK